VREGEDDMLNIIGEGTGGEGDGSEFLMSRVREWRRSSHLNQKQMIIARTAHKGLDVP
jgi:hypothetical protein